MASSLYTLKNRRLEFNFHSGQQKAWDSLKRFVVMLAGTQGGKTSFLPWWLWKEIQRCGSGDYLAVTANYDLFKLKFLPSLREVFEHTTQWGRYWASDRVIELKNPYTGKFEANRADDPMWARIILRSAESGSGLESSSAKAGILDEAGMPSFQLETWEAVLRRLSLSRGRLALGSTIYDLGWLKTKLYDPWEDAGRDHPSIDVIQFDSIENPSFPRQEYEDRAVDMPTWRFDMMYRGLYTQLAGKIYDCFDKDLHVCVPFGIPQSWPRYRGLDFGGVNTVATFFAEEPETGMWYGYREYHAGNRTASEHAENMAVGEWGIPFRCVGGSGSEQQWRDEFAAAGLPVEEPDQKSVEVGITRVYGGLKRCRVKFFDTMVKTIEQVKNYSRVIGKDGEPTMEIKDKAAQHYVDSLRYILGWRFRENAGGWGDVQLPSFEETEYYSREREY